MAMTREESQTLTEVDQGGQTSAGGSITPIGRDEGVAGMTVDPRTVPGATQTRARARWPDVEIVIPSGTRFIIKEVDDRSAKLIVRVSAQLAARNLLTMDVVGEVPNAPSDTARP